MIQSVDQMHSLVGNIDLECGVCENCGSVHVAMEGHTFGCELQITDVCADRGESAYICYRDR
jgi:hypothetical protein